MTFVERWNMIMEGMLGVPATPEQKLLFENGVAPTYTMYGGPVSWEGMTLEQQAEVCVNNTHQHHVELSKQYEYSQAMQAAASDASAVDDVLKQADAPEATTAKRKKK